MLGYFFFSIIKPLLFLGSVHELAGDNYFVEDSVGNMEEISRQNIISDEDDASNTIQVNDVFFLYH